MCERPGSVYEDHVGCEQHYEDAVRQGDQPTVPLGLPLRKHTAEQQVEAKPANQAEEHLQHRHGGLQEKHDPHPQLQALCVGFQWV